MFKFAMGERVKDIISGYEGIIVARTEYLTGCARYAMQSEKVSKETGRPQEWVHIDENQIKSLGSVKEIKEKEPKEKPAKIGGPRPDMGKVPFNF